MDGRNRNSIWAGKYIIFILGGKYLEFYQHDSDKGGKLTMVRVVAIMVQTFFDNQRNKNNFSIVYDLETFGRKKNLKLYIQGESLTCPNNKPNCVR